VNYIVVNEQRAAEEGEKASGSNASADGNRIEFDIVCSTGNPWPIHSVMLNEGAAQKNSKNGLYMFGAYEANGTNKLQIDFDPLSAATLGETVALQGFIIVTME